MVNIPISICLSMYTACVHVIVENTTKGDVIVESLGDVSILNMDLIHFWIFIFFSDLNHVLGINSHIFRICMVQ